VYTNVPGVLNIGGEYTEDVEIGDPVEFNTHEKVANPLPPL
jgi:hypothetical protein